MVDAILGQLESLARRVQIGWLKKIYPEATGLKVGEGFLWQHPGQARSKILARYNLQARHLLARLDTLDTIR